MGGGGFWQTSEVERLVYLYKYNQSISHILLIKIFCLRYLYTLCRSSLITHHGRWHLAKFVRGVPSGMRNGGLSVWGEFLKHSNVTKIMKRDISFFLRDISICAIEEISLSLREISLIKILREISLWLKEISLKLKEISLKLKEISLNLKEISL